MYMDIDRDRDININIVKEGISNFVSIYTSVAT